MATARTLDAASNTPEVRLKRFLYTSCEQPKFITGNPEHLGCYKPEKLPSISELVTASNPELFLNIIEIANSENLLPRRETLFFALAYAASLTLDASVKHKVYTIVLNTIKTAEELCLFIKYFSTLKKENSVPSGVNKVIGVYYSQKEPMELAKEIGKGNGYHGWKHKDLIKLSHCKSSTISFTVIATYILKGLKCAKEAALGNEELTPIIDYLSLVDELKHCENQKRIIELIRELQCDSEYRVPSYFHNILEIWEALLPQLPISSLLTHLLKFYKHGFFKNSAFQNRFIENLTNPDKIKNSKIHPIAVFIQYKNFAKGGKPMDPQLEKYLAEKAGKEATELLKKARQVPKCTLVMNALQQTIATAFQNCSATGKRYMITVEMSERMDNPCLASSNVNCMEAAAILVATILKTEKQVTIAGFNKTHLSILPIDKGSSVAQVLTKLKQAKGKSVGATTPLEWATTEKKPIDVFIYCMSYHHWWSTLSKELRPTQHPAELLNKYKKEMKLPNSKLITFSFNSPHLNVAVGSGSKNLLDICGFGPEVPTIIEAFSKSLFY